MKRLTVILGLVLWFGAMGARRSNAQLCDLLVTCTPTPSNTPSNTPMPTDTPTETFTPSDTPTGTWVSPTPSDTPTETFTPSVSSSPTFNIYQYATLTSGQVARINYEMSVGDILESTLLLVVIGVLVFIAFILMSRLK